MRRKKPPLPIAELNITNLIDITFALLIIFMITAPMLTQGVKVELPKLKASSIETKGTISIHILKNRSIIVENNDSKESIQISQFSHKFNKIFKRDPKPVIINSDKKVPYGIVMQIIGKLKEIGVGQLGFLTDPNESRDAIQSLNLK